MPNRFPERQRKRDYEVGYGRPPKASQFKPNQSGNPKGRPRKSKNFATLFAEALNRPIAIEENGRRRKIPVSEALVRRTVNEALKGNLKALSFLFAQGIELVDEPARIRASIPDDAPAEQLAEFYRAMIKKPY